MSNVKGILTSSYDFQITGIRDSINIELDDDQSTLENLGFEVNRCERLVNYDAAQCLTARKGNVVLRASRSLRGGKTFSITLKQGGHKNRTMNLYTDKINEAIAAVKAAQYFVE